MEAAATIPKRSKIISEKLQFLPIEKDWLNSSIIETYKYYDQKWVWDLSYGYPHE